MNRRPSHKLSDIQLYSLVKEALACIKNEDIAGATCAMMKVPVSQRVYVRRAIKGTIEDKKSVQS